ncbi:MAG: Si-specific NAD(P)(+) transhydrogenase [Planctomycetota bacterium]
MSGATLESYDIVIIGSGPAGQKAAIQGAKLNRRVLVVEQESQVGGACVHSGTIPSKTLRETAASLTGFSRRSGNVYQVRASGDLQVASLMTRLEQVVKAHERYIGEQLARNRIDHWHGRARFLSPREIEVLSVDGRKRRVTARFIAIATGSRPRAPADVPIDHENVVDSDSILSMTYLPQSLTVLGAGVIASEYASIFAALGVRVTMIDKGERPLAFLDAELTDRFLGDFIAHGGRYLGQQRVASVSWDGLCEVVATLADGSLVRSEKLLCALGRVANLEGLNIGAAGLQPNDRGLLSVNEHCQTAVPHIYAIGDVIGPPSLASSSMEQGRRAICHALGQSVGSAPETIPVGIYTIPEISTVGLTEAQAVARLGAAMVGRARFTELARAQIAACQDGLLKMVADPAGQRLLGVQIIGEQAAELIHVGQMALLMGMEIDGFVDNIFNFPTLAEAYRVAALDIAEQRGKRLAWIASPVAGNQHVDQGAARAVGPLDR